MMNRIEAIHTLAHLRDDLIKGAKITSEHYPNEIEEIINYIEAQDDMLLDLKNHKGSPLTCGNCPAGKKNAL